jgi:hypothetical protein
LGLERNADAGTGASGHLGNHSGVDQLPGCIALVCVWLLTQFLYGMYGIEIVDLARSGSNRIAAVVSDLLWTVGPHLHFADFTSRLTFCWGALP